LFAGGWLHTTDRDERVFNVQTANLFIDLRIPRSREKIFGKKKYSSLQELNPMEVRLYARQHIFAGFSHFHCDEMEEQSFEELEGRPACTRHHCIDWNFVGTPRSRPNKWWIEMNDDKTKWKEYAYAMDENAQYYYFEQWELRDDSKLPRLALRKASAHSRDGIFVLMGDHFNYVFARTLQGDEKEYNEATLVGLVDAAVAAGDLETARSYLSIEGGHGRVSQGWKLDCAIPPWNEGKELWKPDDIKVEGESIDSCHVLWNGEKWELYDCSFGSVQDMRDCFDSSLREGRKRPLET
jgi:hypothetical protein